MLKKIRLDVLIVYNSASAASAGSSAASVAVPFDMNSPNASYNEVYGYLLDSCRNLGLRAALSTSDDICGAGTCRSFWTYEKSNWLKHKTLCTSSLFFDKFSPTTDKLREKRSLLFSRHNFKPYTSPTTYGIFFDKLKTYSTLKQFAIPTLSIRTNSLSGLKIQCRRLQSLVSASGNPEDYMTQIIMKDRYGSGGNKVFIFEPEEESQMQRILAENPDNSFIIQPLIKFNRGFRYRGKYASTDIRLVYLDGKVVQSYIRVAKKGDFRCNEHAGGLLSYIPLSAIPHVITRQAAKIKKVLPNQNSLISLDFLLSNSGKPYFLEGNCGPGLDWNINLVENERKSKQLIMLLAQNFLSTIELSKAKAKPKLSQIKKDPYISPILSV